MYGPTETTIWSSVGRVQPGSDPVLIGRPIANTQFYIVDEQLEPVPTGVVGELLIAGDGLSRGYRNLPRLAFETVYRDLIHGSGKSCLQDRGPGTVWCGWAHSVASDDLIIK